MLGSSKVDLTRPDLTSPVSQAKKGAPSRSQSKGHVPASPRDCGYTSTLPTVLGLLLGTWNYPRLKVPSDQELD